MKLDKSEVLLLSQILYSAKVSNAIDWDQANRFDVLYEKLSKYLTGVNLKEDSYDNVEEVEDCTDFIKHVETSYNDEHCSWQDEDESSSEDNDEEIEVKPDYCVEPAKLLDLSQIQVTESDGNQRSIKFVSGISSKCVDIDFDGGEEVVCDVTEIILDQTSLKINTNMGWLDFKVQNPAKSWTSLLKTGKVVGVRSE